MAKKKRITRKELLKEPDEFYTFSSRLFRFVLEHKMHFAYALGAVFALAIIISGVRYFSYKAENRAFALLDQEIAKYHAVVGDKGPIKAHQEVAAGFQDILKKYSGNDGGRIAGLMYANICLRADGAEEAIGLFQKALDDFEDQPLIQTLILSGLGYAYEEKKAYQKAADCFAKIASAPGKTLKDGALFSLGRIYAKMGNTASSRDAFQKIIADHPDSVYTDIVKEKI